MVKYLPSSPILTTLKRRDEWRNRFHPEVLDLYVTYGMYDTENGTIKLKCPKTQEYHVFKNSLYETNTALRSLPLIKRPTHFVYGLSSNFLGRDQAHNIVELNKSKISLSFVEGGHMVPNEKPDIIVPEITKVLERINNESKSVSPSKL
ncbi:hypothetical protein EDC96DRAFT_581343 [Choanephora cucurbitarum]|nr:hypothetical protein EDC96DRAFT_581343 [Choanephora cucurbitarum]